MPTYYNLWGATNAVNIEISNDIFPNQAWLDEQEELFNRPQHGWFESTYKNKKLHYRKNIPNNNNNNGEVKGILVYHHGICGHSGFGMKLKNGQYTDQALRIRQMNDAGIAVYSFDALGHGFSEGTRFYIPNGHWTYLRDDLIEFCKLAANDYPNVPMFVAGDSFGGCLAFHTAYYFQMNDDERPNAFVGCCLNCPSIEADLPPKLIELFLRYCLAPIFPKWTPFFMPHPITKERIWKNAEAREYFSNPDKMHDLARGGVPFCLGTAVGLLTSLKEAQRISKAFNQPFHISHGDEDCGVPLSGSQYLYDVSLTPNDKKSLNVVAGGYHGLFSEDNAKDILDHEIQWIQERIQEFEMK